MAVAVDVHGCIQLLRSCGAATGRQLHQLLFKSGHVPCSLPPTNSVLLMYSRCSPAHSRDARRLFDEMHTKNCFSYNTLITAFINSGDLPAALRIFHSMPERNNFSWNAMITGAAAAGYLNTARDLLDEMPVKDVVACNAVLHRYVRCGQVDEAFALVKRIGLQGNSEATSSPWNDTFVLTTVVGACADRMKYEFGRQAHARIVVAKSEIDSVLGCALIDMYCKCGDLDSARYVHDGLKRVDDFSLSSLIYGYAACGQWDEALCLFDKVENPSVVLWNSFISGCVSACHGDGAFVLFVRMMRSNVLPDNSTYVSILNVCGFLGMLKPGLQVHGCALKSGAVSDLVAASALIDFYSKCSLWEDACRAFSELRFHDTIVLNSMITVYSNCGQIHEARRVFGMITCKSVISWNSMIVGFSQNGHALDAMELFCEMHRLGLQLDKVSVASALSASSSICSISFGEQIFSLSIALGLQSDQVVASSLIDLYCKCGNLANGYRIFDGIAKPDEVLWNSMLLGYASNGYGHEALELLKLMQNRGIKPSERTFIAVLSACCHSGLVEEGLRWFHRMQEDFGVSPSAEHYSCVIDLLVRAGRLDEAVDFIENMPFKADTLSWTSIVGGCKAQGNEALLQKVARKAINMELSPHSSLYVQLSSILAAQGDWVKSAEIRGMMHEKRIYATLLSQFANSINKGSTKEKLTQNKRLLSPNMARSTKDYLCMLRFIWPSCSFQQLIRVWVTALLRFKKTKAFPSPKKKFVSATDLAETQLSLKAIWVAIHPNSGSNVSIVRKTKPPLLAAAVSAWAFLVTNLGSSRRNNDSWKETITFLSNLLEAEERAVWIAGGEALALCYVLKLLDVSSSEEADVDSETRETCGSKTQLFLDIQAVKAKIYDLVYNLSMEAGSRGADKKNLNDQKDLFQRSADFIKNGKSPEKSRKISGKSGVLGVTSWREWIQLDYLRRFVGRGFLKHAQDNDSLHDSFDMKVYRTENMSTLK
ncbi:hypothetical protein EJB05_06007, partial [Eragrostis curvula]